MLRFIMAQHTSGLASYSPGVPKLLAVCVEFVVPASEIVGPEPVIITTEARHPTFELTRHCHFRVTVTIPDNLQPEVRFEYHGIPIAMNRKSWVSILVWQFYSFLVHLDGKFLMEPNFCFSYEY